MGGVGRATLWVPSPSSRTLVCGRCLGVVCCLALPLVLGVPMSLHTTKKVGRFWTQATESDYDALRRPTAAQNDRTSITNDSRHIDTCQTVQEVLKSCDMYPFGPLDTRDTSTRFASRCSPTRPQRTSRGTLPPSQPGRTIEPPKRGLSAPRSSEVVVTVPLRTFAR